MNLKAYLWKIIWIYILKKNGAYEEYLSCVLGPGTSESERGDFI